MARTTASVSTTLDLKTLRAQADEIAKKLSASEAKPAWEQHHEAFRKFAALQGVNLVEREFDTPVEGATPYSYSSCYHWFETGRKDEYGRIEICDLRRSRKRLDGSLKCVYDCGFFTPA